MNKNTFKYLIDMTIFNVLSAITVIGLLLGFVIPTGHSENKNFLGLHRHDWGDIHLCLSLFLIALIAIHIWLNWTWIINTTKKFFGEKWDKTLYMLSAGWVAIIVIGWLAVLIF